jgi:hypothetical protein
MRMRSSCRRFEVLGGASIFFCKRKPTRSWKFEHLVCQCFYRLRFAFALSSDTRILFYLCFLISFRDHFCFLTPLYAFLSPFQFMFLLFLCVALLSRAWPPLLVSTSFHPTCSVVPFPLTSYSHLSTFPFYPVLSDSLHTLYPNTDTLTTILIFSSILALTRDVCRQR